MFDISTVGDLNGGSEYFSKWVAQCVPSAPEPDDDSGHLVLIIVLSVVGVALVLAGAAFAVKRRRAGRSGGEGLEEPINPDMKTSW